MGGARGRMTEAGLVAIVALLSWKLCVELVISSRIFSGDKIAA